MIGPLSALRRVAVGARDGLDRLLHPLRRAGARSRLVRIAPRSVLFVCLGNVCRSPYAERRWASRAPHTSVASAGFIGPDRSPPEQALTAALARGVDHADHRSRLLTADMLRTADVVFVFDRYHLRQLRAVPGVEAANVFWLGDFDPAWAGRRSIADPWGKSDEDYANAFDRIGRCIDDAVDAAAPVSARDS